VCGDDHFTPEDESGDSIDERSDAVFDCRLLLTAGSDADVFKDPGLRATHKALRGLSREEIRKSVRPVLRVLTSAGEPLVEVDAVVRDTETGEDLALGR